MNGIEFWDNVDRRGDEECWPWTRSRNGKGYGLLQFLEMPTTQKAHRIAWLLTYGDLPAGKHVMHHCDNPPCCNPKHLFIGTNHDNVLDRMHKGRMPLGEKASSSKLTEAMVLAIREEYIAHQTSCEKLAAKYPVNACAIFCVLTYRTWPHVAPELRDKIVMRPKVRRGEDAARAKLVPFQVIEMRECFALGQSVRDLAERFGVSRNSAWRIVTHRNWKHIP